MRTDQVLNAAFREVTLAMTGVLQLHDAGPDLVASFADVLRQTWRGRLARHQDGHLGSPHPMEDLLDEIDAAK